MSIEFKIRDYKISELRSSTINELYQEGEYNDCIQEICETLKEIKHIHDKRLKCIRQFDIVRCYHLIEKIRIGHNPIDHQEIFQCTRNIAYIVTENPELFPKDFSQDAFVLVSLELSRRDSIEAMKSAYLMDPQRLFTEYTTEESGSELLCWLVDMDDKELLDQIIQNKHLHPKLNPNYTQYHLPDALSRAISKNNTRNIEQLLSLGADIFLGGYDSAISYLINQNRWELVEKCLEYRPDLTKDEYNTVRRLLQDEQDYMEEGYISAEGYEKSRIPETLRKRFHLSIPDMLCGYYVVDVLINEHIGYTIETRDFMNRREAVDYLAELLCSNEQQYELLTKYLTMEDSSIKLLEQDYTRYYQIISKDDLYPDDLQKNISLQINIHDAKDLSHILG